ncbi:threonine/homoserine/homoserine lactone efflux protein [Actinokineospora baliensis]|uniref:LysE family translocator n=1 Tax=Actinokineospora baliensis TaxID=547056 RepID=UPI0019575E99|nr:LysE family translocator [Actinokineospora baliensis]MBM7774348.1 threonine/homoserine/homoserine lactone efflux protein [Actinokineospora baliensis]
MIPWAFVLTCVVVAVSPGPALAVMINQSLRWGRPAGFAAVAGNTTGLVFWAAASVFGLTALIHASEVAFVTLKIVGAAYLCWVGVQALRRSRRTPDLPVPVDTGPPGLLASYRTGLVTNLTNPKAGVLYLALFPQFLIPGEDTLTHTAVLAAAQMSISATWYSLVVLVVGTVREALSRPTVRRRMDQVMGVVLIGLGIRLATAST